MHTAIPSITKCSYHWASLALCGCCFHWYNIVSSHGVYKKTHKGLFKSIADPTEQLSDSGSLKRLPCNLDATASVFYFHANEVMHDTYKPAEAEA